MPNSTTNFLTTARRYLPFAPFLLFTALALFYFYGLSKTSNSSEIPSALMGKALPEFSLPPLESDESGYAPVPGLSTADFKGHKTLLVVWASWCSACRAGHQTLVDLAQNRGWRIAGINFKDDPKKARAFLKQKQNPFSAIGVDSTGKTGIDLGIYGLPEAFVISEDGTVIYRLIGPLAPQDITILEKLMAPSSS
jgi:cytochrome c biogenesis protein CcmG/thiol:disulfide interchange protein DsbE